MTRITLALLMCALFQPYVSALAEEPTQPPIPEVDGSVFVGMRFRELPNRYFGGWMLGDSHGVSHVEETGTGVSAPQSVAGAQ